MSDPFIAQIQPIAFSWAPKDWSKCDGQQLAISSAQAVYSLIGSMYGGNDRTFFNLPNLKGRTPVGFGTSDMFSTTYPLGAMGGTEYVALSQAQLPTHTHDVYATDEPGNTNFPSFPGSDHQFALDGANYYHAATNLQAIHDSTVDYVGGGQSHYNLQPYNVLNFIFAMDGTYPARN